jgi:hypothetical protein
VIGSRVRLSYRPPHGKLNLVTWLWLILHGIEVRSWTITAGDTSRWRELPAERAAEELRRRGGGVVLLHDHHRDDPQAIAWVLRAVAAVLAVASVPRQSSASSASREAAASATASASSS